MIFSSTTNGAFQKGDRFKVVGGVQSNIDQEREGKFATIIKHVKTNTYEVLFDDGSIVSGWLNDGDMKYIGRYPLEIGFRVRNKIDKSEWLITHITDEYEFRGKCIKASSNYQINDSGGSRKLEEYEIISKTLTNSHTIMNKLSIMMKKLLDKDTQILVKAGFINGDLDLTGEGQNALNTVLFIEKKAELVKLAEEVLAEAEKNK